MLPLLGGCASPNLASFDGTTWWNHIKVLADDNMEGRETGSEGLKRAETYVVAQLDAAGVEPAGTQRYHAPSDDLNQPVDLAAAGKYEDVIRTLMTMVANAAEWPQWKPDSFYRRYSSGD